MTSFLNKRIILARDRQSTQVNENPSCSAQKLKGTNKYAKAVDGGTSGHQAGEQGSSLCPSGHQHLEYTCAKQAKEAHSKPFEAA